MDTRKTFIITSTNSLWYNNTILQTIPKNIIPSWMYNLHQNDSLLFVTYIYCKLTNKIHGYSPCIIYYPLTYPFSIFSYFHKVLHILYQVHVISLTSTFPPIYPQ